MDRQMKGEYFKMKNHGLRRIFSLFLALFMVFTLLPTTALAEDTTGADETQPKTVVVDEGEKKTDPPAQGQPKNENPPAPEEPKTFTVTYTDGADGAVFDNEVHSNLPSGTATPAFSGSLAREGYTFVGWNPAVAETVTADVTYAAKWEAGKTSARRVTVPPIPDPGVAPAALNTGHKIDVTFTVLYVGDEFNIGYNYGSSEKTKFVCQYKTNHSDTAYNNHTIAISDIKAAAGRASVNSGYQIVGWSKESNANPTTWSLNKSGTTACNKGTTIYLVAKNPNPTTKYTYTLNYDANGGTGAPSADSWSTTDASIRYHSFTVKNTIPTREGYVFKGWKANDGSDTIYTGGMTCAVSQYGNDVVKNGNTWTRTLYAVWEEAAPPTPDKPTAPGEGDLSGLIGNITVNCTNEAATHDHKSKSYALISGSYTTSEVAGDAESGYTCTVTVLADNYVEKYNTVYSGHTLFDNNTKTIKLVYRYGEWTVVGSNSVTFNVSCEQKYTVTYTDGVDGEVIFKDQVSYKKPGEKTPKFRGTPTRTGYKFIGWEPAVVGTVTANATYTAQWVSISDLDPAPELVSSLYMNFQCTNENASHDHRSEMIAIGYGIGAGGVIVTDAAGNPVYNKDGNITAVITFYQDSGFLNEYNKRTGVAHRYADYEPKTKSVDGVLIGEVFHMYKKDYPVVFDVVCGSLYTVTYKDGTNGTVFADDVHSNLNANAATPAFVGGTPTRPGYVFTGWNPAVAATVTGNATYTAVWEKDANGNGKPDKDEEKYTVTYTDGVENEEIFADETYSDLLSGTATPAFNGTPTRKGYVFTGWNPAVAATVTGNATYAAVWEEDANGNGTPDKEEEKYTVSYTDGVENEEIFANQVYGNLLSGTATPAFNGTPTRTGYVFGGWNPAVAATVTGNATYTAVWEEDANGNGTPDKEEEKYTVSYTDGVENEEIFANQVYGNLLPGTATPAFEGTPARAGYKFLGWEPTVAETVTENATYVAQWEKLYTVTYTDGVGGKAFEDDVHSDLEKDTKTPAYKDGIPTRKGFKFLGWEPEVADTVTEDVTYTAKWEKLYTVTYTDGVKGKAFKDQVYSDLEAGTDTPKFDGKPTRKGYTFTGWSPKVTDTVTKDVTYVAQWKSTKNGKDNIPKTGDSEIVMVLGSVLLFSFCGAAAVSVYDRKRKHF